MRYLHDTTEFYSDVPTAVTLGKFDGLHRGHQKLLNEIVRLQKENYKGVVFNIAPDKGPVLLTGDEKRSVLESLGMDCMIQCPFIPEILHMEPEEFVSRILIDGLKAKYVVVGTDFRFGCNRSGDVDTLASLQSRYGFTLKAIEKECFEGREISSTYVREALAASDMELVETLLGYPYTVKGRVQHGRQLGRRIGMPTINLVPESRKMLPPDGVYYSDVAIDGQQYYGVTNIGYKPTVDGSFLGVETYLFGISENLYGCETEVHIRKFRRPEQKFGSVEELKAQMEQDIRSGKLYFGIE